MIGAWVVVLVAAVAANRAWGGTYEDDFTLPDTSVQSGVDVLDEHGDAGTRGTASQIVLHADDGLDAHADEIDDVQRALAALPHVLSVVAPTSAPAAVSENGTIGYYTVRFDDSPVSFDATYVDDVDQAVADLRTDGVDVEYGGPLGQLARPETAHGLSEAIGLGTAVVVLLLVFGSLAAAGLPLVSAVIGLLCGLSVLGLFAARFSFGAASPTLATMMGLGVGLDYALFLTTRHRKLLRDGVDPVEAAGRTVATSGRAVVVAAATVAMALAGLYASGVLFIGALGAAAGTTVIVAALASLTLAPALLGVLGRRIDRWYVRKPVDEPDGDHDFWHRWSGMVGRRPWAFLLLGLVALGALSAPLLSMRLGHVDAGSHPVDYTDRRAYDLITDGFGEGTNGQFTVVVALDDARAATDTERGRLASSLHAALTGTQDVSAATTPLPTSDGQALISTVTPVEGPQAESTDDLLHTLQDDVLPDTLKGTGAEGYVTGTAAGQLTFRDVVGERLPLIITVVVAAAFLLLLMVFRGVVIALTAALLNLVSISAAYGVVVAVFQWQWGGSLLGVQESVPIESYVPMMMFAIVFGLSMDYEVFLLSRIRETWLETEDNHLSVATGQAATARVISAAALIMTSVFLAFLLSTDVVIKMMALGLGVSVIVDATVVRLLLVPAAMYICGRSNWWLPPWLDRMLPRLDPEGHHRASVTPAVTDDGAEGATSPASSPASGVSGSTAGAS